MDLPEPHGNAYQAHKAWPAFQHVRGMVSADVIPALKNYAGGAGQKSAVPKIKEDLWNAAQDQISM